MYDVCFVYFRKYEYDCKMPTLNIVNCVAVILFCLVTTVYIIQKIGAVYDRVCKPEEESAHWSKWWTFTLTTITRWAWDLWSAALVNKEIQHNADEESSEPDCDSSVLEILGYIFITDIWLDIKMLCWASADIISKARVTMLKTFWWWWSWTAGSLENCFDQWTESFWMLWQKTQTGFNNLWSGLAEFYIQTVVTAHSFNIYTAALFVSLFSCIGVIVVFCKSQPNKNRPNSNIEDSYYDFDSKAVTSQYFSSSLNHQSQVLSFPSIPTDSASKLVPKTEAVAENRLCVDSRSRTCSSRSLTPLMLFTYCALTLLSISIPWEFCRLYQMAIGHRAAVASAGAPAECGMESLSLLQTFKIWLSEQLAWSHGNPCERYYHAMFVDPLWEITPLMVLISVVTRCVLYPAELLASGLGRALRNFFTQIPLHWQPVCMLLIVALTLLTLLMTCSYRLHIPLLLRFEPKSPSLLTNKGAGSREGHVTKVDAGCRGTRMFSGVKQGDLDCERVGAAYSASDVQSDRIHLPVAVTSRLPKYPHASRSLIHFPHETPFPVERENDPATMTRASKFGQTRTKVNKGRKSPHSPIVGARHPLREVDAMAESQLTSAASSSRTEGKGHSKHRGRGKVT